MAYLGRARRQAARPTIDGFTPEQRVFLGWAQIWCENARPEAERLQAQTNPHSSGRYRVNGVVSNMPEFQKAFRARRTRRWCGRTRAASGEATGGSRSVGSVDR